MLICFLVAYTGNAKLWWKFAYNCIVDTEVKRKMENWSWTHIREHRKTCREYKELYRTKLMSKKPSALMLQNCEIFENKLDLFNLLLIRQCVDVEVEVSGKREAAAQQLEKQQKSWFSGWWGKKEDDTQSTADNGDISKFRCR